MMLASRFEDAIFNSASSLVDYRKKIAKRLKKAQKNYVPQQAQKTTNDADQRVLDLRRKYGEDLQFIYVNSTQAVVQMKEKSGAEKASHLQQHFDNVKQWVTQLGLLPSSDPKTMPQLTPSELDRLEQQLEQRIENIRGHVVKLTKPDLFLKEKLIELEEKHMSPQSSETLAEAMSRRFDSLEWSEFADPPTILQRSLDKALQRIPPPSRDPRSKTNAGLTHLEAMRAASQAMVAYLAAGNNPLASIPKNVLSKCHAVAVNGCKFLQEEFPTELAEQEDKKTTNVTLEHAWTKVMETPTQEVIEDSLSGTPASAIIGSPPAAKRQKPTIVRSRVLLTPGRACPSNLLPALKRKGATLCRPSNDSAYLFLDFEAFEMTIYLVPLVVLLSAKVTTGPIRVWGAEGTWETLGNVVRDRLDYASAQATRVLRDCFANGTLRARADFEMEISEATSLLKFLQLARTTYMPDWQDVE
jgi:hypothetical protein